MAMVLSSKEIMAVQKVLNEKFGCGLSVNGSMDATTVNALRLHVGTGKDSLFPPTSVDSLHPSIRQAVKDKLSVPKPQSNNNKVKVEESAKAVEKVTTSEVEADVATDSSTAEEM